MLKVLVISNLWFKGCRCIFVNSKIVLKYMNMFIGFKLLEIFV